MMGNTLYGLHELKSGGFGGQEVMGNTFYGLHELKSKLDHLTHFFSQ